MEDLIDTLLWDVAHFFVKMIKNMRSAKRIPIRVWKPAEELDVAAQTTFPFHQWVEPACFTDARSLSSQENSMS